MSAAALPMIVAAPASKPRIDRSGAQMKDAPTAPAKPTDRRSLEGEAVRCEAIPPDATTGRLDLAAYNFVVAEEVRIRGEFRRTLLPALRQVGGAA